MIKKWLSFALVCLLLVTSSSSLVSAQIKTENDASSIAKIKAKIVKRGTGESKLVEVKMLDGTERRGYISQAGEDSFTLTDSETKQSGSVSYSGVARVKYRASKAEKITTGIITGALAAAAVVLVIAFVQIKNN